MIRRAKRTDGTWCVKLEVTVIEGGRGGKNNEESERGSNGRRGGAPWNNLATDEAALKHRGDRADERERDGERVTWNED